MEPPAPEPAPAPELAEGLSRLGEDLLLLAVRPRDGSIVTAAQINFGLMGSELVRLAALRRVDIAGDRIIVLHRDPTGDPSWTGAGQPGRRAAAAAQARGSAIPGAGSGTPTWSRLVAAGALSQRAGRAPRPQALDGHRAAARPAGGAGPARRHRSVSAGPVDMIQAAFGGLAHAVGLDRLLYPRFADRPRCAGGWPRSRQGKWTTPDSPRRSSAADAAARARAWPRRRRPRCRPPPTRPSRPPCRRQRRRPRGGRRAADAPGTPGGQAGITRQRRASRRRRAQARARPGGRGRPR